MAELRIVIPDRLEQKLQSAMPDYLDRKGFVCLLLDKALDGSDTLGLAKRSDGASPSSSSKSSIEEKNKEKRFCFSVPTDLSDFKADLLDYWRNHKSGKKSEAAAKILISGCRKIKELYGDAALKEQLELAKGYGWENITLKNYERYGLNQKAAAKEPEPRHPAYRVFTADNGFGDDDPTTNPILEELF